MTDCGVEALVDVRAVLSISLESGITDATPSAVQNVTVSVGRTTVGRAIVSSIGAEVVLLTVVGEPMSVSRMEIALVIGASTVVYSNAGHLRWISRVENVTVRTLATLETRLIASIRSIVRSTGSRTRRDAVGVFRMRRAVGRTRDGRIITPTRDINTRNLGLALVHESLQSGTLESRISAGIVEAVIIVVTDRFHSHRGAVLQNSLSVLGIKDNRAEGHSLGDVAFLGSIRHDVTVHASVNSIIELRIVVGSPLVSEVVGGSLRLLYSAIAHRNESSVGKSEIVVAKSVEISGKSTDGSGSTKSWYIGNDETERRVVEVDFDELIILDNHIISSHCDRDLPGGRGRIVVWNVDSNIIEEHIELFVHEDSLTVELHVHRIHV